VRAETDRYLGRLGAEYGVPLIDTRDWMNDTDFADGFHLWPEAAAVFTERFAPEVLPAGAPLRPPPAPRGGKAGPLFPGAARRGGRAVAPRRPRPGPQADARPRRGAGRPRLGRVRGPVVGVPSAPLRAARRREQPPVHGLVLPAFAAAARPAAVVLLQPVRP